MSFPPQQPPGQGALSKVAIPRLGRRAEPPPKPNHNRQNRVSRACLSCRARKIRCNGARPTCANCSENSSPCVYESSRKDRLKTATQQNQDMMALLAELQEHVSDADKHKIEDMLNAVTDDVADAAAAVQKSLGKPQEYYSSPKPESGLEERGEATVTAEVGSNEDLDMLDEDLLRNEKSRATGFLGKPSEVQLLRKLHHVADTSAARDQEQSYDGPYGPPGSSAEAVAERVEAMERRREKQASSIMNTSNVTFFLDDEHVELDFMVDPFELPPFETAERLMQAYMDSVQNSFPFIAKKTFLKQYHHYYAAVRRGSPYKLPQRWQAMLNLLFAIGAVYSHLIDPERRADDRDHLTYHSRAWALSLKDPWWFSHPDIPQMQVTGLLSFYYLSIGHINRSWVLIGMALRFGYALGMHVRNEDRTTTAARKEVLSRIWWGHYCLEQTVSAITGRPSVGMEKNVSVPLPLPLPSEEINEIIIQSRFEDSSRTQTLRDNPPLDTSSVSEFSGPQFEPANSGSYLKYAVTVGEITQKALSTLYSPSAVSGSWATIQKSIVDLSEELDVWASSLPPGLNFFHRDGIDHRYQREQNILELYHHSARILIMRPCLCRLDRRIQNQSASSNDFNKRAALACVDAAKAVSNLLPDDMSRDQIRLYQNGPWWSMVHTIMQALVVLLLEVSYEAVHFPDDRQQVIPSLKKLMRWYSVLDHPSKVDHSWILMALRENNRMASRAYSIALDILRKLVVNIEIDISDLLSEDSVSAASFCSQNQPQIFAQGYVPSNEQFAGQYQEPINTYSSTILDPPGFPQDPITHQSQGAPLNPFPDFFDCHRLSHPPFQNLFFTTFDEQNTLPITSGDIFMGNYE